MLTIPKNSSEPTRIRPTDVARVHMIERLFDTLDE